ncbi:Rieske (2Fe-2S) protein [Pseudonocardia sp.]|uniref:Rieske (2Fe-2S) protein n=1 Tax=Pseudonocardia sp. TaxID=60912 RepID=UPI003D0BC7C5
MLIPLGEPDGRAAWTVTAPDGREFAVFCVDGRLHVTNARCPHNKGPLVEGTIRDGRTLVCPWHWFRFDLETGECANLRMYDLRVHPVVERDGAWFAEVDEPAPQQSLSERLRAHARGEG